MTMWLPANKDALPSTEEMRCAKGAIKELEIMLKDAVELLEQAKERVVALTKNLDERQAWIAPIRKVPIEILSEIFIFTSAVDDLSPVTITEVNRFWRKVILSTPRAWSLIYADMLEGGKIFPDIWGRNGPGGFPPQYFSTFIQRSGPCMLHITMPPDEDELNEDVSDEELETYCPSPAQQAVDSVMDRVQCLSLASWQMTRLEVFPNLTKLGLTNTYYEIQASSFTRSRFPCLRYLDCVNCPLRRSQEPGSTFFPPLQHLAVSILGEGWIELVQGCAGSLVGLEIRGVSRPAGNLEVSTSFPKLIGLNLGIESDVSIWPVHAMTPSLQSYEETTAESFQQSTLHRDVKTVTHASICQMVDLVDFVALRILQLDLRVHKSPLHVIRTILHRLKEKKDICPALQAIQFVLSHETYGDLISESRIPGFNSAVQRVRPHLTLSFTQESSVEFPGTVAEVECDASMPCKRQWRNL